MKKKILKMIVLLAGVLLFAVGCGNESEVIDSHSIEAIGNYDVAEDTEKTTGAVIPWGYDIGTGYERNHHSLQSISE